MLKTLVVILVRLIGLIHWRPHGIHALASYAMDVGSKYPSHEAAWKAWFTATFEWSTAVKSTAHSHLTDLSPECLSTRSPRRRSGRCDAPGPCRSCRSPAPLP